MRWASGYLGRHRLRQSVPLDSSRPAAPPRGHSISSEALVATAQRHSSPAGGAPVSCTSRIALMPRRSGAAPGSAGLLTGQDRHALGILGRDDSPLAVLLLDDPGENPVPRRSTSSSSDPTWRSHGCPDVQDPVLRERVDHEGRSSAGHASEPVSDVEQAAVAPTSGAAVKACRKSRRLSGVMNESSELGWSSRADSSPRRKSA